MSSNLFSLASVIGAGFTLLCMMPALSQTTSKNQTNPNPMHPAVLDIHDVTRPAATANVIASGIVQKYEADAVTNIYSVMFHPPQQDRLLFQSSPGVEPGPPANNTLNPALSQHLKAIFAAYTASQPPSPLGIRRGADLGDLSERVHTLTGEETNADIFQFRSEAFMSENQLESEEAQKETDDVIQKTSDLGDQVTQQVTDQQQTVAKKLIDAVLLDRNFAKNVGPIQAPSIETIAWLTAIGQCFTVTQNTNVLTLNPPFREVKGFTLAIENLLLFNDALNKTVLSPDQLKGVFTTIDQELVDIPAYLITAREYASFSALQTDVHEVRFSNNLRRFDAAGQLIEGDLHGWGLLSLVDISSSAAAYAKAARDSRALAKKAAANVAAPITLEAAGVTAGAIIQHENMIDKIIEAYLGQRHALNLSYQHINEFGSIWNFGYDTSKLFPLRPHQASDGISYTLSLQASDFIQSSRPRAILTPSVGVAIAWQNEVPFKADNDWFESYTLLSLQGYNKEDEKRKERVRHWSVQTGILSNYYIHDVPRSVGAIGGFVRYRDRKNILEYSLNAGFGINQSGYVTIGFVAGWSQ